MILNAVVCLLIVVVTTSGLPLSRERATREFGFPSDVKVEEQRPSNSCYITVALQQVKRVDYNPENPIVKNETTNTTVRHCCEGYTGDECNIIKDEYMKSNPCFGKACPNFPNAVCSTISQCGVDSAVFLDESGKIVDCGSEEESSVNITTLSCIGFCAEDPCANLSCQKFPNALCLTIGCSCQPIWLLETGVSVDCNTGDIVSPEIEQNRRRRREVGSTLEACRR